MGHKHFTEEQIAFALRQAESGTSVPGLFFLLSEVAVSLRDQIFHGFTAIGAKPGGPWMGGDFYEYPAGSSWPGSPGLPGSGCSGAISRQA